MTHASSKIVKQEKEEVSFKDIDMELPGAL
jgi:hypothetical protein